MPVDPATAIARLLRPASIAVFGATEKPGYGARLIVNLTKGGYRGSVYPINPNRATVFDLPCYPSLSALPAPPEAALIVVPAPAVAGVVRECTAAGVAGAVVISAGFAELGTEADRQRQAELRALALGGGPRLVGPNCLGLANLVDSLWATSSTTIDPAPPTGQVGAALISQSGATGFGPLLTAARDRGFRFRYVVTTGNEADLSAEDFLDYFLRQPDLRVVSLLVESFRDFRRLRALGELAATLDKTVLMLKIGRSEAGQRAAQSHTAALTGPDRVQDALFRQFGLLRVRDYDELAEQTALFVKAPRAGGRRVGVVSHSGGVGSHLCDQLGEQGLEVPPLGEATRQAVGAILGPRGSAANPADLTTFTFGEAFGPILTSLFADPGLDAWLIATHGGDDLARTVIAAAGRTDKPVAVVWTGSQNSPAGLPLLRESALPVFGYPSGAARGLAALARRSSFRPRPRPAVPDQPLDLPPELEGSLSELQSQRLLAAAGLEPPPQQLCTGPAQALAAAEALGYPVVLKGCAPRLPHKTELGLVRLDLRGPADLSAAFAEVEAALRQAAGPRAEGVLVQRFLRGGVETIVGLSNDPLLGPLLLLGLGGTLVETLGLVTWRACPIDASEAEAMIDDLPPLAALLGGVRGSPPADRAALARALAALSLLPARLGARLESLDVNPLLVRPPGQGVVTLDALAILRPMSSRSIPQSEARA